MGELRFTWDSRKTSSNQRKHGISFEEAETVFYDENARLMSDPDHSHDEDRFVMIGMSSKLRTLVVCHCYRRGDSVIRIISARKATKREQGLYLENVS